jgi:NADPH2:quinone reductase
LEEQPVFAHRVVDFTGPANVGWVEVDEPVAGGGVVVEVAAAGVSFADLLQTCGRYQLDLPLPFTPGMDAAGVVRWAPAQTGVRVGQRVAVLASHGCWQEVVTAPPEWVLPLPDDMSLRWVRLFPSTTSPVCLRWCVVGAREPGRRSWCTVARAV